MKIFYVILGTLFLALGIIGIFLPLLPTTPFLLLTAGLYLKSSPRLYGWLMTHRRLGPYIHNYRDKRAITLQTKVVSVALLWVTITICIVFVVDTLWVRIMLGCIMAGVTVHILSFRTMSREDVVRMVKVRSGEDVGELSALADEIWSEYYTSIITPEQIKYMVGMFQSPAAVSAQISEEGYEYYFINAGGVNVGYIGVRPETGKLFLSKIYVREGERGKGYAGEALTFVDNICRRKRLPAVWLTVNRNNVTGIAVYEKRGYSIVREQVADIGNGYVMDDYVMEKKIS